jgi:hypothetical protein
VDQEVGSSVSDSGSAEPSLGPLTPVALFCKRPSPINGMGTLHTVNRVISPLDPEAQPPEWMYMGGCPSRSLRHATTSPLHRSR